MTLIYRIITGKYVSVIIQLMHSSGVDFRICQSENSEVHRGKANGEHHFQGLTYPDVNRKKNIPIVLLYNTVSIFLVLIKVFSYL